ncbi:MAG: hypothetical protein ACRDL7_06980, partial [Gaiellaceae bacterium]
MIKAMERPRENCYCEECEVARGRTPTIEKKEAEPMPKKEPVPETAISSHDDEKSIKSEQSEWSETETASARVPETVPGMVVASHANSKYNSWSDVVKGIKIVRKSMSEHTGEQHTNEGEEISLSRGLTESETSLTIETNDKNVGKSFDLNFLFSQPRELMRLAPPVLRVAGKVRRSVARAPRRKMHYRQPRGQPPRPKGVRLRQRRGERRILCVVKGKERSDPKDWFAMDSGAVDCLTNNYRDLEDPQPCNEVYTVGNNDELRATYVGKGSLHPRDSEETIEIPKLYFCPKLATKLVSLGVLTALGYVVTFEKNEMHVFKEGKPVASMSKHLDHLYYLVEKLPGDAIRKQVLAIAPTKDIMVAH